MADNDEILDLERLKRELDNVKIDLSGVMDMTRREIQYEHYSDEKNKSGNTTSHMIYADSKPDAPLFMAPTYTQLAGYPQSTPQIEYYRPSSIEPLKVISQPSPFVLNQPVQTLPRVIRSYPAEQTHQYHEVSHAHELHHPKVAIRSADEFYSTASRLQQMDQASLAKLFLPHDVRQLFSNTNLGLEVKKIAEKHKCMVKFG